MATALGIIEEDLRPIVDHYFRGRGFRTYSEVFLLERWIDLLAVRDEVVAVELKIRDWRQAVKQATMYQLAADYTFVAMPWANAFTANRHRGAFEDDGVGLLAVRGDAVRVLLDPQPSLRRLPWLAEDLRAEGGPVRKRISRRNTGGFTAADELAERDLGDLERSSGR